MFRPNKEVSLDLLKTAGTGFKSGSFVVGGDGLLKHDRTTGTVQQLVSCRLSIS